MDYKPHTFTFTYNKKLKELMDNKDTDYQTLEKAIRKALVKTVGEKTIKVNTNAKPREPENIRELRSRKREKKKQIPARVTYRKKGGSTGILPSPRRSEKSHRGS